MDAHHFVGGRVAGSHIRNSGGLRHFPSTVEHPGNCHTFRTGYGSCRNSPVEAILQTAQRAYAQYLLAIQNDPDGPTFDRHVDVIRESYSYPHLWNFYVYSAQKRLWPLVQSANVWQGWNRKDSAYREAIHDALNQLQKGGKDQENNDASEIAVWTAVAYALLGGPIEALGHLRQVQDGRLLEPLRQWLDLFWDMFTDSSSLEIGGLAKMWDIDNVADTPERLTAVVSEFWHERSQPSLPEPKTYYYLLGYFVKTRHCARIRIIPLTKEGNHSAIWRIDVRTYKDHPWPPAPSIDVIQQLEYPTSEAVQWIMENFVGLVVAPHELRSRWKDEEDELYREALDSANLSNDFLGKPSRTK